MEKMNHRNLRILSMRSLKQLVAVSCVAILAACGGGGSDPSFPLSVEVSGLTQGGLVLQNKGVDPLTINGNGIFKFSKAVPNKGDYAVTVRTQPANQVCTVAAGTGSKVTKAIPPVKVTCVAKTSTVSVGGAVSGLDQGASFVLQNNGANDLAVSSNDGYSFQVPYGSDYLISVSQQPTNGQTCSVSNATGTGVTSNVTNVDVTCSRQTFTIGGVVKGLNAGQSVTLLNEGGDPKQVDGNGNDVGFTFSNPVAQGGHYAVTVGTQPTEQTCSVNSNGSGTVTGNVTDVEVLCSANTYTIGGDLTGLIDGYQITLALNGQPQQAPMTANGHFEFQVAPGTTYTVSVNAYPFLQKCDVENGTGTANGNVNNVAVNCELASTSVVYHFPRNNGDEYFPVGLMEQKTSANTVLYGLATLRKVADIANNDKTGYIFKMTPPAGPKDADNIWLAGSGPNLARKNPAFPTGLMQAIDGTIYGTKFVGGTDCSSDDGRVCYGAIFSLNSNNVLAPEFASFPSTNPGPVSELIQDSAGNFYGITYGAIETINLNTGAIFKMTPQGTVTVVHSFSISDGNGYLPNGKLLLVKEGSSQDEIVYGTTEKGGAYGTGTIFKYNLTTNMHVYAQSFEAGGSFPANHPSIVGYLTNPYELPYSGLIQATDGNLYGVAKFGGDHDAGYIFKMTPLGNLNKVYSFTTDNGYPANELIQLQDGKLYGVTQGSVNTSNNGIVFRLPLPTAQLPTPTLEVLHTFAGTGVNDGDNPNTRLIFARDGNLYGTTQNGGKFDQGVVFKLGRN